MESDIKLMHEIGMLAKTPRSGFAFLGSGKQSVAEHSYRMTLIALILAKHIDENVNKEKLMLMCLIHDLPEARTSDLNYVNKRYVHVDDEAVLEDIRKSYACGPDYVDCIHEYDTKASIESIIAHEADQIELLLVLKEQMEAGNPRAQDWYENVVKRLTTEVGRKFAQEILNVPSEAWWYIKHDDHWVHGNQKIKEKTL